MWLIEIGYGLPKTKGTTEEREHREILSYISNSNSFLQSSQVCMKFMFSSGIMVAIFILHD